tara:strand:+ start:1212 stop:1640 length:429 start_codon:yes stop_codon:yes gene_type:complete
MEKLIMKKKGRSRMLRVSMIVLASFIAGVLMSAATQDKGQPIVPKLSQFRGDVFKNFAEFRVQNSLFDKAGILVMQGSPFKMLINCNTIIKVYRFEDGKKTDYSCLMFIREHKDPTQQLKPILVRETYKDVLRKMKRAIESR